jgi:hypothetical protein
MGGNVAPGPSFPIASTFSGAGDNAINPQLCTVALFDTSVAGAAMNALLPALTSVTPGYTLTVKNTDGAFDVTLVPSGTDKIDEIAATVALSIFGALPAKIGITLMADPVAGTWRFI